MKLKIISFNIKNNFSRSQKEQKRLDEIIKFLNEENADVIGLQEVNSYVRKILAVALRDYYVIGDSRFITENRWNEYNILLLKKERIQIINENTVWLTIEAKEEYARIGILPRICTYATLLIDNKEEITVFNTHLDVVSARVRKKQLTSIIKRMQQKHASAPLIGMGDFNLSFTKKNSDFLKQLMEVNHCDLKPIYESYPVQSLTRDSWWRKKGFPIDYFLLSSHWKVSYFSLYHGTNKGNDLSDHIPLICQLEKSGHIA